MARRPPPSSTSSSPTRTSTVLTPSPVAHPPRRVRPCSAAGSRPSPPCAMSASRSGSPTAGATRRFRAHRDLRRRNSPPGFTYRAAGGMEAIIIGSTRWIGLPAISAGKSRRAPPSSCLRNGMRSTPARPDSRSSVKRRSTVSAASLLAFVAPELTEPRRTVAWYLWWVGEDRIRAQGGDGFSPPLHAQRVQRLRRADRTRPTDGAGDPGRERNARHLSAPASTSTAAPPRGIRGVAAAEAAPAIFLLFWSEVRRR